MNFDLPALIEALLFVSPSPVSVQQLAAALEISSSQVEAALQELEQRLLSPAPPSYLQLQKHQGRYQLTTAPQIAPLVERFLGIDAPSRLTQAALETLAVIAYRQPITRSQIEAIRGVNSDSVLRSLLSKGLIQEAGRAEAPGRPILYTVTPEFLQHFGLSSIEELPPWDRETGEESMSSTTSEQAPELKH
ncbi:MAG: SMC-Scp complex subunit ScpB [Anaerolineales bacterium]|nr:SMC-Scp complex subunit ScpB [Anaerolineales bacterium]MCS7246821.1 SMC-Scp complex subunit ScpB [Anaerolineales bacterium]MDW8160631.1 SMC-Scp complex subunit ScpB [Anaerolineales bacterium]MDW8447152.1 SMC-Scp complex subunit ScpB [Anaerolineales bacterium]